MPKKRTTRTNQPKRPPRVTLTVKLAVSTAAQILNIAQLESWSVSRVISVMLTDYLETINHHGKRR